MRQTTSSARRDQNVTSAGIGELGIAAFRKKA
jgi:hypothetical protein